MTCDVCGLPDPYRGQGDGIGSCYCPRCPGCGAARSSYLCECPYEDCCDDPDCGWYDRCEDDGEPWPDVIVLPVVTVELPGVSR